MVTLHNVNSIEFMKSMLDQSIDVVITDPPYGINLASDGFVGGDTKYAKAKNFKVQTWDKEKVNLDDVFRVSKNQVIFGGNYYDLPKTNSWIVWDKKVKNNWNDNFSDGELAWTSFSKPLRIIRCLSIGYHWNHESDGERVHPSQKPLSVMRWILENYSSPGDLVFDPFMGSGSTGVACVEMGRKFIGCELSPEYFSIAKKRIEQASLQPSYLHARLTQRAADGGESPAQSSFYFPE
jgi:site-specific DNA-methyltransferase (adenine-specific)